MRIRSGIRVFRGAALAAGILAGGMLAAPCLTHAEAAGEDSAATDIAHWATLPTDGPEGRPLPLTGSWNIGRYWHQSWKEGDGNPQPQAWDPTYFTELIEQGHHVLPTFPDPMTRQETPTGDFGVLGVRFVPALQYCAEHDLPIAFRDWNLADKLAQFEGRQDGGYSNADSARFIRNGKQLGRVASPIGAIERWRDFGRAWGGSPYVHAMAEIYPDPPLVVYLNNNETGEVPLRQLNENATRFIEQYGKGLSESRKRKILHEGYKRRYHALFDAARAAAPAQWPEAMTFVAYNAFPWPKLRQVTPLQIEPGNLPERFAEWAYFDGAIPENYMNDWQVGRGKTDFSAWSPQAEATTYVPLANAVLQQQPDYYFASIGWEGGIPGKRGTPAHDYAIGQFGGGAVQRWDTDRYMGMLQFGLWAMRPRVFREFRGGATRDAYHQKTWQVYLDIVDRVWERERLQPFWKHGELVENPDIRWQPGNAPRMQLKRWYLLYSDANPSPAQWPKIYTKNTVELRVFALALRLGEAPARRWLVYAHAPLGAVRDTRVKLPGYGNVTLDTVSRRGSFYIVHERDEKVEQVIRGGPTRIELTTDRQYVRPGEMVQIDTAVTCPPESGFERFKWTFGSAGERTHGTARAWKLRPNENGQHTIRVVGTTGAGDAITAETTLWVGAKPNEATVYDVPLDRASHWRGPWQVTGKRWPGELQTYRLLPNRGAAPAPVLHGGRFVDDPQQGRVLELRGAEGIRCERTSRTVMHTHGHANKTIAFRFKAERLAPRQVLYSEGHGNAGFNVYLDDGKLYAGGWGRKKKFGSWAGDWIQTEAPIDADRWYHVALVLKDATDTLKPGRMLLYIDGERVGSAPARRLPAHHVAPHLGLARTTRFHDGKTGSNRMFRGRLADFRLINAAAPQPQPTR